MPRTYEVTVKETWEAESVFRVEASSPEEAKKIAEQRGGECVVDSEGWNMIDWEARRPKEVESHA